MAKLVYTAITSLDGYVCDAQGRFDWAAPDDEVHAFVNDLQRPVGTYLLGRRTYEVMAVWDNVQQLSDESPVFLDFASLWQAADKIVYSRTIDQATRAKTRVVREFDPDAVRRLTATSEHDISVGGPGLAGEAFRAALIDEIHLFLNPIIVGAGTRALPDDVRLHLDLLDERRFDNGVTHLHYRIGTAS